jgi:phosphate transport system ATP-binding protein
MTISDLSVYYGDNHAVKHVSLPIRQGEVLALIGPSGCGKTTLLRTLNRLTELTGTARREGLITLDGTDIDSLEVTEHRRRVSMVFQQPNPFPMSVFDNVAYALREQGAKRPKKKVLEPYVVDALQRAGLYDEVSSNLDHPALRLSGGQQQRLCIARAIAVGPEVLLMDEPCSALDPASTRSVEDLIFELREQYTIVIVTHNMQQAARVSDVTAMMMLVGESRAGSVIEIGPTETIFTRPKDKRTEDYVTGRFG